MALAPVRVFSSFSILSSHLCQLHIQDGQFRVDRLGLCRQGLEVGQPLHYGLIDELGMVPQPSQLLLSARFEQRRYCVPVGLPTLILINACAVFATHLGTGERPRPPVASAVITSQ